MGRRELGIEQIPMPAPDKGFFPNLDLDDIPPGGSGNCKHVFYRRSQLRPFPGMDLINSSQAGQTRGSGVHYLDVNGATVRTVSFGTTLYSESSGTLTAISGITLTDGADNLVQMIDWQSGSNKFLIGCNGVDNPFKWVGSGAGAALGGSPPVFTSIAEYRGHLFGSNAEYTYFSATDDAETYDTSNWRLSFPFDVTRLINHGKSLAVFTDRAIGSVRGYDRLDFTKEESEVDHVGCVGRLAATNILFGSEDVKAVLTVAKNGVWLVDEAYGVQKVIGDTFFEDFNQANLHKATVAYWEREGLAFIALPKDDTENDYLIVLNTRTGAWWPGPSIHGNNIRALGTMRDSSEDEYVYYVDGDGYAFKFNITTKNYHTGTASQAIDSFWESGLIDLKLVSSLSGALFLFDTSGDWNVTCSIGFGLTSSVGDSGAINVGGDADLLGTTFILGSSMLGGSNYVFEELDGVGGFGRWIKYSVANADLDETFGLKKAELHVKPRRLGGDDT